MIMPTVSRMLSAALLLLACFMLTACPPDSSIDVSVRPTGLPIVITASMDGKITMRAASEVQIPTPIGTFSAAVSIDPAAMFGVQGVEHVLVIDIDGEQHVYDLHGQNVDVRFEDGYYRALRIYQDSDKNWHVKLQKMQQPTVAQPTVIRAADITPQIRGKEGELESLLPWWREDQSGKQDGMHNPTSFSPDEYCYGLVWNTNEYGYHRLVVFQSTSVFSFADGGWYSKVCIPNNVQVAPKDIGEIVADSLGKRYGIDNVPWMVIVQ